MTDPIAQTPPHGGDVYGLARSLGLRLNDLLDFSANINPLGFPPGVVEALEASLKEIVHYPDRRCLALRQELAAYHHLAPDQILVGNGSTELIYLAARALKPARGLIVTPAFSEYEHALNAAGVPVVFHPTDEDHDFSLHQVPEIKAGDLVFLAHPSSPSGVLLEPGVFEAVAEAVEDAGAFLFLDEAFIDFVAGASFKTHLGRFPHLMILRSFTKFFGMPGTRLGFLLAAPEITARLGEAQEPWSVSTMAQFMGRACLADKDYIRRTRALIEQERQFLYDRLAALPGLKPFPGTVNYLLVKLEGPGATAAQLQRQMLAHHVIIRDASNFRGLDERFFRLAVRSRGENQQLLLALEKCLAS